MQLFFWFCLFLVFYTFIGYAIVLYILVKIKRLIQPQPKPNHNLNSLPTLTLVVAAYNEADIIDEKIVNTLGLTYPLEKIKYIFVTDGSTDNTPQKIQKYPTIKLLNSPERKGKIVAIHRAMKEVITELVVFTDANTILNNDALLNIARHYADKKVGAVSGEKRVKISTSSDATSGEGFYWKYESLLKKWDSELYSVVGAAGELFSVRKDLYIQVEPDTVLDDFMISLRIAEKGYKIIYEPNAFALEESSANTQEELKRKIRIAAGGIQSILRLKSLLNPFKNPILCFQYMSHRVLRWTVTPFAIIVIFVLNFFILLQAAAVIYKITFAAQCAFYLSAFIGWAFERRKIKIKAFFIPFYFCFMNYAVILGIIRYSFFEQKAAWEKVKRKQ